MILALEQFPVTGGRVQTLTGAVVVVVGGGGRVGRVGRVRGGGDPKRLSRGPNGEGMVVISGPIGMLIRVE